MNSSSRIVLIALFVLAATSLALAGSSPVGKWKGRVVLDTSKMAAAPNPQVQAGVQKSIAVAKKIAITMVFKADKTYSATTTGVPVKESKPETGTWTQSGATVTLTGSTKGADGKAHSQSFTMSKNGQTMVAILPGGMGIVAKLILSR